MEHPSKNIIGAKGKSLEDKNIAVCITGSVAAIRAVDFVRYLMRRGASVRVVMSKNATELVTPELLHWASGNSVVTKLTGEIEHVKIAKWADAIIVAPSTGNTIGKMANSIDDTPPTSVVSVAQGLEKPIGVVPAMHGSMYDHEIIRENINKLKDVGVRFLEPVEEEGKAKIPPVEEMASFVVSLFYSDLDQKILITAGPTREKIDDLRYITNYSSGKMGVMLARAAASRGAEVTLVYGPGTESEPCGMRIERTNSTEEMFEMVKKEVETGEYDLLVSAAAPMDFKPEKKIEGKIKHGESLNLDLVATPRILENATKLSSSIYKIGFKAEYDVSDQELVSIARKKLESVGLDMVVANDVSRKDAGFGTETNQVSIVTEETVKNLKGSKIRIANEIFDIYSEND